MVVMLVRVVPARVSKEPVVLEVVVAVQVALIRVVLLVDVVVVLVAETLEHVGGVPMSFR